MFGSGSRAPVAITILVKNPKSLHDGCRILYRDIGDYLTREQKLETLKDAGAISGISEWQTITPDRYYDWIAQRSDEFARFYPLGSKDTKKGISDDAVFKLYSNGYKSGRDPYIYNFSHDACAENARRMTEDYLRALEELERNPELTPEEVTRRHASNIKWAVELRENLRRNKSTEFRQSTIWKSLYRPFIATNFYADYTFLQCTYQMDRIFPENSSKNHVICVPGIGTTKPFSALMTEVIPDLNINAAGTQCFPRYRYSKLTNAASTLQGIASGPDRVDNISDTALRAFCERYSNDTITKGTIFDYVYGLLHAHTYREEFANDLSKELPRLPFAPDFHAFAEAGKALGELHVGYEVCERYPLQLVLAHEGEPQARHFLLTERAMRFADDQKTTLRINEHVSLSGIPAEAHRYVVNGRTPLEWYIDRYRIKKDKESGIVNDPNGWFEDPRDLVAAIERIVHVSVESTQIIEGLPKELSGGTG